MKRSGYPITSFNPVLIRWLSATVPGILPSAWGGRIPPITVPGRHRKLDDYVAGQGFPGKNNRFVDMGCGFPPVTTADTASRFPDWQVCGVDQYFADYVLDDEAGSYACFNREGDLLYFQLSTALAGRPHADFNSIKNRFIRGFRTLFPLLRNMDALSWESVEKDGKRLTRNPILEFGTGNLRFIASDIKGLSPMDATVCRCMNLFIYFSPDMKDTMLRCMADHIRDNGLLIIGTNSFGIQGRYAVYEKRCGRLSLREFAFSLDNLGHISIMPWFTLHDKDPEATLLAELSGVIRSAPSFWPEFSGALDQLLENHGFCTRKADGFLHFPKATMVPQTFLEKNGRLWRKMAELGYADGAVDILEKAGYTSWINPAGDIAVRPPADSASQPGYL